MLVLQFIEVERDGGGRDGRGKGVGMWEMENWKGKGQGEGKEEGERGREKGRKGRREEEGVVKGVGGGGHVTAVPVLVKICVMYIMFVVLASAGSVFLS